MGNHQKLKRSKKIFFDYDGDGRFSEEFIPKFWKRYWRKWLLRKKNKEALKDYEK